jgi:branched-subunit amino acid transport protein
MTHPWFILVLALGTFGLRVSGLALGGVRIPASWERAWRYLPLALLSALIALSLTGRETNETGTRVVALVVAAVVTYRLRHLWVCIVVGMAAYLLLRSVI